MFSTGRDLHVDQNLTNLAINYRPQNFIADLIAPIVPVDKQTNRYPVFSRFEFFATEDTTRAPGTEAKKITRSVSSGQYECKNYALARDITVEDQANMDDAYRFELDAGATRYLLGKLNLDFEKRVITLLSNTAAVGSLFVTNSVWGGTPQAGANNGDPIAALFQLKEYVFSTTGQQPNSLLAGWRAWNYLLRNYNARNFFKGVNNGGGTVTRDQIAAQLELDRVNVSNALWHTANEAAVNSGVLQNPIADRVYMYYAPTAPSREDPSWMYSFRWQNPQLPTPLAVIRHPYNSRKQIDTIEAGYYQDEKIVAPEYGAGLLTNVASGAAGLG